MLTRIIFLGVMAAFCIFRTVRNYELSVDKWFQVEDDGDSLYYLTNMVDKEKYNKSLIWLAISDFIIAGWYILIYRYAYMGKEEVKCWCYSSIATMVVIIVFLFIKDRILLWEKPSLTAKVTAFFVAIVAIGILIS